MDSKSEHANILLKLYCYESPEEKTKIQKQIT